MLSKSKIVRGIRCQKSLWLNVHKPELSLVAPSQQAIFARGTDVGVLARDYFPGGELALTGDRPDTGSVDRTRELIRQGVKTIYEATFVYDHTLVAVDILTCIDGRWNLVECKSTTGVKPEHITDVAVQYYVVTGAGIALEDASVIHLNNRYIRKGEQEIKNLFSCKSVLTEVQQKQEFVGKNIVPLLEMLGNDEPAMGMGKQCTDPYECDFQVYCRSLQPLKPVPEPDHTPIIRKDAIHKQLENFGYPVYFLDFETISPAIPMFDESRPYQQIPFQYSLHYRETREGETFHSAYLAWPDGDPRRELIEQLINDTRQPGKILTYNVSFERTRLKELARDFPPYKIELEGIINRLEDLMPVFRRKEWHAPSMGRGYSIKTVLPLMAPELSYETMEIANGGDASSQFLRLYGNEDQQLIERTRKALLEYCYLDTWAMVRIMDELEKIVF